MVLLVIIFFTGIALIQIPGLIRKKFWPELIVSGILLLAGFVVSSLLAMGFSLPFVSDGISQGLRNIFNMK